MSETYTFNTIEEILEDLKAGKNIILIDDEDRENEGDVICAGEFATLENVNFMAAHARGADLYAYVKRICGPSGASSDVCSQYRQS